MPDSSNRAPTVTGSTEMDNVLTVRGLSITFESAGGDVPAVDDLSFTVGRREVLAVVGESGSGKSATAMAILGLLPKNARVQGEVTVAGAEVVGASNRELRRLRARSISVIFQDPVTALTPVYSIGFQIREAIRLHDPSLGRVAADARAVELLTAVGMPDPERRMKFYPHQLSGGQCQRVMIAIALASDPELLIADEPTTALDVTVQAEVLELLRALRERVSTSIMLITHDMGVVADIADRVIVMHNGRMVEQAPTESLFGRPTQAYTRELLAAVPRIAIDREVAPPREDQAEEVLRLDDVSVTFGSALGEPVKAVRDVSLHVQRGEVVGLVGESGSGKSTVGRCAAGLLMPTSGQVSVLGGSFRGRPRSTRDLRRRIGVVFQSPVGSLDPKLTVGQGIGEPLRVHRGMRGRPLAERVASLLDSVGLSKNWADRYPHEMSGGQLQRVSIARAIALDPELIIADEPTSALDVSVQAKVLATFRALQENLGFACLFISHNLAVVDELCNRVLVMRLGTVVEEGATTSVLRAPANDYTRALVAAAPVPDPVEQRRRREARLER